MEVRISIALIFEIIDGFRLDLDRCLLNNVDHLLKKLNVFVNNTNVITLNIVTNRNERIRVCSNDQERTLLSMVHDSI